MHDTPQMGRARALYTLAHRRSPAQDGVLIATGASQPNGALQAPLAAEDLAPSIAARLGVTLDDVDGKVVPWLGRADGVEAAFGAGPARNV